MKGFCRYGNELLFFIKIWEYKLFLKMEDSRSGLGKAGCGKVSMSVFCMYGNELSFFIKNLGI
jgi:hypothetical protein